jgi:hypothetical protein
MQHSIYTLEKEMLWEAARRTRAEALPPAPGPAPAPRPAAPWEVLIVTRTIVRIGPLVLAWDRQ